MPERLVLFRSANVRCKKRTSPSRIDSGYKNICSCIMRTTKQQRVSSMPDKLKGNGFDTIISLKSHIALLTMVKDAKEEVEKAKGKGINLLAAKALGRCVVADLDKSRHKMKANKMWVQDVPIGERLYRYSILGRREEYEISQAELDFYRRMIIGDIEKQYKL
jgi:hypothetical protein